MENQVGALLTNTRQAGAADSVSLNFGLGRTADGYIRSVDAIKLLKEQQWTGTPSTVDAALVFSTVSNETVSEKMRITSEGNVGIGTTSPQQKLDTPNIIISGSSIAASYRANATLMDNLGGTARFYSLGADNSTGGSYQFNSLSANATAGSGTVMTILNSGNVGIGTTSPAQNFVVADATNGNGVELVPGATGTLQAYNRGTSVYVPLNIDTLEARVRSIGATVFNNGFRFFQKSMRIDSAGNVGIGTTAPLNKLHVAGSVRATSGVYFNSTSTAYFKIEK